MCATVAISMERYRLTVDQAFRLLARANHTLNRKLRDIAEELSRPTRYRSNRLVRGAGGLELADH
jgi:ANTAR domain